MLIKKGKLKMTDNIKNKRLSIDHIKFGKTDAFNELIEFGTDYFIDSFVENERYCKNEFLNGNKFLIIGKKGTGKTAFLRYLECQLDIPENIVIPIRFKSDFDEIDKEFFTSVVDEKQSIPDKDIESYDTKGIITQKSYVLMWKSFLIYSIVSHIHQGEYDVFESDEKYKLMISLLKELYGGDWNKKIILPKLKKGNIEISTKFASTLNAELKLEMEYEKNTKKANYAKIAKKIYNLFTVLKFVSTPVYILVDELELSVRNKEMNQKDIALVRDLILAIDEINRLCHQKAYNIHIIASVRSEVVTSVVSAGFEVNKCIEDYGVTINWFQKGGNYLENPLLKIVERKIHASEKANGLSISKDIWNSYFESTIHNTEVRKYLLNNTWYRPRDIIRLLLLLQLESVNKYCFDQESFDRAQQEYSNRMWMEFSEELRLEYTPEDLSAIKTFFTKIPIPFTYNSLSERAKQLGDIIPNVKCFFEKVTIAEFIQKMFEIGIIGNTGERMVFSFLGDQDISVLDPMVIHNPLRNFFAVQHS